MKKKVSTIFSVALISCLVLPPIWSSASEREKSRPLKIGVIGPETGEESEIGRMTLEGVEIAAEVFNQRGGVNGKPLEYIHMDNKGSSVVTNTAVENLILARVIAIIGAPAGWSTFAPVYAANESETIFIAAGTKRHVGRSGPFVFRMSLPIEGAAEELMDYCAKTMGFKRFFIVTVMMDDEALNVASAFRKGAMKKGITIKGEGSIFTEEDVRESVKALKANMPVDGVIFAGSAEMAVLFAKEAKKSGLDLPLIGGDELYKEAFLSAGVEGSIVYAGFSPDDTEPITKEFVEYYKKKKGALPTSFVADAYDSFMLLSTAIKDAGSTNPRIVMEHFMRIKEFHGVTGVITMAGGHEAIRRPYLLKVVKGKDGSRAFSIVKSPHGK